VQQRQDQVKRELTRLSQQMDKLLDAYQEGLMTLAELRKRARTNSGFALGKGCNSILEALCVSARRVGPFFLLKRSGRFGSAGTPDDF
jgi:hypothetical protein